MKHLIIGGVAGGATAAARIRRADETAQIILLEKGKHISYANCGLPYYIGGTIKQREKLFVQTPEAFARRYAVDVRTQSEAIAIDTQRRAVTVRCSDGTTYDESYDRLLLSPGSVPVMPPLEGIDCEGIFALRNVEDTDRIKHYIDTHHVEQAVVVGAGFIGIEMAENLHHAGARVTIVELADQVMTPIDFSMAAMVHRHLLDKGVRLLLSTAVKRFEAHNGRIRVHWADAARNAHIDADMVLMSVGVKPQTQLAKEAGIELGKKGIKVNPYLETSATGVYAVGDAIEFMHPITGEPWLNLLAGPANRQARIVADNMVFGNSTPYEGAIGTAIAKVFDITVAATGLPAKRLKQLGRDYQSSWTISQSHAGYYPKAFPITTKIMFDPKDGTLLGAQCVGNDGVDKRIDQLALAIKRQGTVFDLMKLEQAYAPPFSSAKDPIAIAGYTAANIIRGDMRAVTWRQLSAMNQRDINLIDVRTPQEYALGTIGQAVNIPLDDLRGRLDEIDRNKPVVVFCAVGLRGYLASRILTGNGFDQVYNLSGGYRIYSTATQPIEQPADQPLPSRNSDRTHARVEPSGQPLRVDACGLQCPGPIMQLKQAIDRVDQGEQVEVQATDPAFPRDAQAWCQTTGHRVMAHTEHGGVHTLLIQKDAPTTDDSGRQLAEACGGNNKTIILFSDDLDKAIATFVLANGAAATGTKVSVFCTFWGLNVLKRQHKPAVNKDFFGRMFSWMMPSSSRKLKLSQMSLMGIGGKLIRHIMRKKNIASLEELIIQAQQAGVEFIACQMTMDMMGIDRQELIDGVTIGGVATYMQRASQANVNLFI